MSAEANNGSGGIGFAGALTVLFVGLKLTHYIDWSWWLVLSPMLAGVGLFIVVLVLILVLKLFDL